MPSVSEEECLQNILYHFTISYCSFLSRTDVNTYIFEASDIFESNYNDHVLKNIMLLFIQGPQNAFFYKYGIPQINTSNNKGSTYSTLSYSGEIKYSNRNDCIVYDWRLLYQRHVGGKNLSYLNSLTLK